MYSIVNEEPASLTALRTGVPMEVEWIVGKTLAKDRERRYQSCLELIVDLETLATKLRAESSRVASAMPGPASLTAPSESKGQPASRPGTHTLGGAASAEQGQPLRKRQVRELILDLGSKGLLPDRILSQALEVISRSADERSEVERKRNRLLDDLLYERVRVGEFIEQWHQLESKQPSPAIDAPEGKKTSKRKRKSRDVRSDAEIFGIPLSHKAWGKDPSTGKERIAMGVFACGNISVGLVACARWIAIGGITISPVSIGLWAFGLIAIGLEAGGLFQLSLSELPFWQALLIAIGAALVGGFLFSRQKGKLGDKSDLLDELALFSLREWRHPRPSFREGRVIAICGRYVVDLTEVQPPGEGVAIDATALLGAVRIRVPEGWHVMINGTPILGRFADQTTLAPEQGAAGQRLVVHGTAVLGSVKVEN